VHAATLAGGTGLSTYAAQCVLGIERRTIPGESEAEVVAELKAILDQIGAEDPSFRAHLRTLLARPPFEADRDGDLVRSLADAAVGALGYEPAMVGETPWMDAALLAAAGADTVVFGPHGAGAHAADEWVDLDSVLVFADVLVRTTIDYCGRP
jgi:acetylornithine deacetylase